MSDPSSLPRQSLDDSSLNAPSKQDTPSLDSTPKDSSPQKLGGEALQQVQDPGEKDVAPIDNGGQDVGGDAPVTITLPPPGPGFSFRGLAKKLQALDADAVRAALPGTPAYHASANLHALVVLRSLNIIDDTYLAANAPKDSAAAGALLFNLTDYTNYAEYNAGGLAMLALLPGNALKGGALTLDAFRIMSIFGIVENGVLAAHRQAIVQAVGGALKIDSVIKQTLEATLISDNLRMLGFFKQYKRALQSSDLANLVVDAGNAVAVLTAARKVNDIGLQIHMGELCSLLTQKQKVALIESATAELTNALQALAVGGTGWKEAADDVAQRNPKPPIHLKTILTGLSLGVRIHLPEGPDDEMKKTTGKNSPHLFPTRSGSITPSLVAGLDAPVVSPTTVRC